MESVPVGKPCRLCGEDCAGRPRIKDPKGRYYHKECYEQEMAHRAQRAADAAPAEPVSFDPYADVPDATASAQQPGTKPCPGCSVPLQSDAVVCIACGYDLRTGVTVQPAIDASVGDASTVATKKTVWPIVIGILSVLFGAGGVLLHGLDLVLTVLDSLAAWDGKSLLFISMSMIDLLLSVWLLAAGIGLVVRRPAAARSIRRWAVAKIVIYAIFFGVGVVGLLAIRDTVDWVALEVGLQPGDLEVAPVLGGMVVMLAWFLLWPIFVLIWFARTPVQAEVDAW